jgi:hyaluronan synthase/N-acetylglucosaminyltransferase
VTSLASQFLNVCLHSLFVVYSIVVMSHFALQTWIAHQTFRTARRERANGDRGEPAHAPSVDVVIASYNEEARSLEACLQSLIDQDYPGPLNVHVVDDASPNRDELADVYAHFGALPNWHVYLPTENRGKRHAQDVAFAHCRSEIVVTIDSDTVVDSDGIRELVAAFADGSVGAVTGDVGVMNANVNLLTRLIAMRYWVAFNQERAAQSRFRSVLCCSGPLAAYRRSVLTVVWRDYTSQTFRGVPCTYGDDRHLTNLVLAAGFDTLFMPFAHAITNAPENLSAYLRQQLRWNKSFYREILWTLPFLGRRSPYMAFEVTVQTFLPLLLTLAVTSAFVISIANNPRHLVHYAATIAVMALIRSSYALYRTRDVRFLLFVAYGFLHVAVLVPTRMRALFTLTDNRWGTRETVQTTTAL